MTFRTPTRDQIARTIIGPRLPVPATSQWTLEELQETRWKQSTNGERQDALNAADAVLAAYITPLVTNANLAIDTLQDVAEESDGHRGEDHAACQEKARNTLAALSIEIRPT